MNTRHFTIPMALVLTAGVMAAAVGRDTSTTSSSCMAVLGSEVCTWVVMEGGTATELGATIPLALIEAVPGEAEMVWPPEELASIALPAEARQSLGIDHFGINWEANGHPPETFLTQHFDFHFYNITRDRVRAIDCANEAKPATVPANYTLPDIDVPGMGTLVGLCVPLMGMHAMPAGEVHETHAFEASMILGYYGAEPIFFEPMVSRELLLRKADFSVPMPTVQGLPHGVRYPAAFRAEYDADAERYRLIFTGFSAE